MPTNLPLSRKLEFPFSYIGKDFIRDGKGRPWWVIQAKLTDTTGKPKCAVVYMEDAQGLHEICRIPEVYGTPQFRADGARLIVLGQTHRADQKEEGISVPIDGWIPVLS